MSQLKLVDESTDLLKDKNSLLNSSLKLLQRYFIEPTGYRLNKITTKDIVVQIDLRAVTDDPIEAVYRAGHSLTSSPNKWVVINIPMDCVRRFPMGFGPDSLHIDPFAQTVKDYLSGSITTYAGSALEKYFAKWQPKSAGELLGLNENEVHDSLQNAPAYGAVWPWDFDSPESRTNMNQHAGWVSCGPIDGEIGTREYARFKFIADAVVNNGYHRNTRILDGDIGAQVLAKDGQWKILICDGMHRFATLRALGWKTIPVSLRRWPMLIRREDVHSWPNVKNGLFNVDSALKVFDLFFNAQQPVSYKGFN